ncbi:glycosyltransferase [Pseudonocardia sp. NPDC049635]|uniref:glycosyltransferase n=1 Tax=Pseudonocardia sp. NPDC049635 TaxID=3155506 RepID=UPI003407F06F
MRVLHVAQPTVAGVYGYVLAAACHQRELGWEVHVACPGDGLLSGALTAAGIEHVRWAATREPGPALAEETRALARVAAHLSPDVVHLHSSKAGLAGRLSLRGRVPTLFQPHGWSWLAARGPQRRAALAWERWAVRWCTRVVACGTGEADQGRQAGIRGPLTVIRNGVDLTRFTDHGPSGRTAARRALGIPQDVPVVVCAGRLTRQKGQDVLIAAWDVVHRNHPTALLVLVGGGNDTATGTAPAGVWRIGPATDIERYYTAADVVALPSRWEGLSLTAMEALATGRSVVASDVPGLSELIIPEVGELVPPDCPERLARALQARLARPELAIREGAAAARLARAFDASRTWENLAALTVAVAEGRTGN